MNCEIEDFQNTDKFLLSPYPVLLVNKPNDAEINCRRAVETEKIVEIAKVSQSGICFANEMNVRSRAYRILKIFFNSRKFFIL